MTITIGTAARRGSMLLAGALVLGLAACGDGKPSGLGDVEKAVQLGEEGAWTAGIEKGTLTLTNSSSERAVRTYRVFPVEGEAKRTVGIDFEIVGGQPSSMAGIVFAHKPERYMLALVAADGQFRLLKREPAGFEEVFTKPLDLAGKGAKRIEVVIDGENADVRFNKESLTTYAGPEVATGNAGIAAAGLGTFTFTGFEGKGYKAVDEDKAN